MSDRKSISGDYQLKHGDLIYLVFKNDQFPVPQPMVGRATPLTNSAGTSSGSSQGASTSTAANPSGREPCESNIYLKPVELDEVDKKLVKSDGLIGRSQNERSCRHGDNAKCVHCIPLEPYDEGYMKEHKIQHMSFHAYLRKLQSGIDKGKFAFLEDIRCKIKPGCKEHAPWPEGICTKCQPTAITLNPQTYRHVDNVSFENATIVDRFLNYWRLTNHQRVGFLYGYYDVYKDVPLGIRAVVVAIYEPPQESTRDSLRLHLDQLDLVHVDSIAGQLGFKRIGWIFTDLISDGGKTGTVKHLRGSESFFLSAQECIMAGHLQNVHPNPCQLSPTGVFGSKFVTVCVTGNKENQIHMEAYQVSNQCMALVRDQCLLPTLDAPELAYVRESSRDQYVPDVFYKAKDKYGNSVTQIARPLPIEYLLIDVPVSALKDQTYTFNPLTSYQPFPIENRFIEGQLQDMRSLINYMNQFDTSISLEAFKDFHLLVYLMHQDRLAHCVEPLLAAIKHGDKGQLQQWMRRDEWLSLQNEMENLMLADHHGSGGGSGGSDQAGWACDHCTFLNESGKTTCDMCSLPKSH